MLTPLDLSHWFLQAFPTLYYLSTAIGLTYFLFYILKIVLGIAKLFRKRINFKQRYGQNSWALVTGSSQGIGRQISSELAKEGFNIVLMARTESKLKKARQELKGQYPSRQIQYIVADLEMEGRKDNINEVLPQLQKYDFSFLVNNAGKDKLALFQHYSLEDIISHINLNSLSLCSLTYKMAQIFRKKVKQGKHCGIINVASIAGGECVMPYYSVYAATKAYVSKLTRNLSMQIPQIDWMVLNPSEVSTSMTCYKNLDIFTIAPSDCAYGTMNDFGYELVTNGHLCHKMQSYIYSLMPRWVFNLIWLNIYAPLDLAHRAKFNETKRIKND